MDRHARVHYTWVQYHFDKVAKYTSKEIHFGNWKVDTKENIG